MNETFDSINTLARDSYATNGAICLRGIFSDWIEILRQGVERNQDPEQDPEGDHAKAAEREEEGLLPGIGRGEGPLASQHFRLGTTIDRRSGRRLA